VDHKKLRKDRGPEAVIQDAIINKLKCLDWFVKNTHGNMYQSGFPDLYACHRTYGARWIEVKNPLKYSFTDAQLRDFPMFSAKGIGIWILTADTDHEIKKLHGPPNWAFYLDIWK